MLFWYLVKNDNTRILAKKNVYSQTVCEQIKKLIQKTLFQCPFNIDAIMFDTGEFIHRLSGKEVE